MREKYIIELENDQIINGHIACPMQIGYRDRPSFFIDTGIDIAHYTEPDLHEVRKKAYEKGYHDAAYNCHEGCNFLDDAKKKADEEYRRGYADCEAHYKAMVQDSDTTEGADAYQRGLNDAWEAARTLWNTPNRKAIFGYTTFSVTLTTLTAQEAIEKIRQYEQEKQEKDAEIKVGKEFQMGERKCVVTHIIDGTQRRVLWDNGVSGLVDNTDLFVNLTPTGRCFPEIATILEKMRGEQDG